MNPPTIPHFLMCPPHYFGVEYVINPWMRGHEGDTVRPAAERQWKGLYRILERLGAHVSLITPEPGKPDLVFTANAGLIRGSVCVPTRFRCAERQAEEPAFRAWFAARGYGLRDLPADVAFEGAGDALFDEGAAAAPCGRPLLWAGHGFRTDLRAHRHLEDAFDADIVSLRLIDPRFYHLDTCFCPLPGGLLLWYPPAFDAASQNAVIGRVPADRRLAVCPEDAARFACNAVGLPMPDGGVRAVVLNDATESLRAALAERGFAVHATPLTEFLKAGGAAKCLTLRVG